MNILLYGNDVALLRKKLTGFKSQFLKMYPEGEVITLYGDNVPELAEIADLFTSESLFGSKKLFILKRWIEILDRKDMHDVLSWLVQGGQQHTIIYYEEDTENPFDVPHFKSLKENNHLEEKYIFYCRRGKFISASLNLTPEQKVYLEQVHNENSVLAEQELTKAALLQRAGKSELINTVFSDYHLAITVFPFIDAVFARDGIRASRLLYDLLAQGENELMLITMLINHLKKILFIVDAEHRKVDINGLLKKMRIHAYVAKKLMQQKQYFSLHTSKAWLAKLLEIDLQAKQGKVDAKVALGQFCVSIGT